MTENKTSITAVIKRHKGPVFSVLLVLLAYAPIFLWMWDRWFARDSYYSHGILIPFVTGYLIWQKRKALARAAYVRSAWGLPLVIMGLIVYLGSALFRVYFTGGASMIMVLCGLILHYYGRVIFRHVAFPLLFLIFMVPIPMVVVTNLSFRMKLFAASIAADILNAIRIPALQEGSIIRMRHAYVIVDDICSGLRSLISLTALATLFAYWLKGPFWKRFSLFLCAVPIAIVTNVFRVVFLASISEIWGPEYADGLTHDISGFMVFTLAFVLLFGVSKVLE